MSNIYAAIQHLSSLVTTGNLPVEQEQFIAKIIDGEKVAVDDLSVSGWSKLKDLAKVPKLDQINNVLQAIATEIGQTSYITLQKPWFNFTYISTLKKVSAELEGVNKFYKRIMSPENSAEITEVRKKRDVIFQKTIDTYHGTIMLPIAQGLDIRLGLSRGECFGYVAEWSNGLLNNQKAFGVSAENAPPFRPITFMSPVGQKYPDLNHLAVLTENISTYQSLQGFGTKKLVELLSRRFDRYDVNHTPYETKRGFYQSIDEVADKLIEKTTIAPEKIYNLNMMGYLSGHALGFCKLKGKYHFFDSNSGWIRFENAGDFKRWLPFYLKKIGYDKMFGEYMIGTYSLTPKANQPEESTPKTAAEWLAIGIILTICSPILVPFLATMIAWQTFDHFVIRGFRYAGMGIAQLVHDIFYPEPVMDEVIADNAPEQNPTIKLSKSLEPLDLAIAPHKKPTHRSSLTAIAAMLDFPLRDLNNVQSRAEQNETIPKFNIGNKRVPDIESLVSQTMLVR